VFIVSDFGGRSCDEIFAITESLPGYPAPSRESGQGIAGDVEAGIGKGSKWPAQVAGTLDAHYGDKWGLEDQHVFGQDCSRFVQGTEGFTPGGFGGYERGCGTLRSQGGDLGGGSETLLTQGADVYNGELTGEVAPTVTSATGISNASGPKVVGQVNMQGSKGNSICDEGDTAYTLNSMHGHDVHAVCSLNGDVTPKASEDVSVTLRSQQGGEGVGVAKENLTVRRLTPKECERLQGFPDEWTIERMELELVDNEWKPTGKVIKQTDGPRYKQMGNAVTVNVAYWLGKRMRKVIDE
jgi:DNA (cytosine-5)-methyltransferase 1